MVHSNSVAHSLRILMILMTAATLGACSGYAVSINDNPVYNPPTLFTDFRLPDPALHDCVQQTIEDQEVTQATQLTQLNCSSAGIESLEGLATFNALQAISLNDNQLEQVDALKALTRLEILLLRDNEISSATPMLSLLRLKELDLRGNGTLGCGDAQQLAQHSEGKVRLPEHCER